MSVAYISSYVCIYVCVQLVQRRSGCSAESCLGLPWIATITAVLLSITVYPVNGAPLQLAAAGK